MLLTDKKTSKRPVSVVENHLISDNKTGKKMFRKTGFCIYRRQGSESKNFL